MAMQVHLGIEGNQTFVIRYDALAPDSFSCVNSACTVAVSEPNLTPFWLYPELAPDGKIYFSQANHAIASIANPEAPCGEVVLSNNVLNGPPATSATLLGVQPLGRNLLQGQLNRIMHGNACAGEPVPFWINPSRFIDSVQWDFGDPASGAANTATTKKPSHTFVGSPPFVVSAIVHHDSFYVDTFTVTISTIYPQPAPPALNDTTLCAADSFALSAEQPLVFYQWNTGHRGPALVPTTAGTYTVTVFNRCDTVSASAAVQLHQPAAIHLGPDTTLCPAEQLTLTPTAATLDSFAWHDGFAALNRTIASANPLALVHDTLSLSTNNACGFESDTLLVIWHPQPSAALPPDTTLCLPDTLALTTPAQDSVVHVWWPVNSPPVISSATTVALSATGRCGTHHDTLHVYADTTPQPHLGPDTVLCPAKPVVLKARTQAGAYRWSTHQSTPTIEVNAAGTYTLLVGVHPCTAADTVVVSDTAACPACQLPNVITPNADGLNDLLTLPEACGSSGTLTIFNRWGQVVFVASQWPYQWDGFVNGLPAADGTYFCQWMGDIAESYTELQLMR